MRAFLTLFLAAATGLTAWAAGGDGTCSGSAGDWSSKSLVTDCCRHACPVARTATTFGRAVAMQTPVATLVRAELEA